MAFNSFQYLLFLPLVVFAYYSMPHRFRWGFLLAASYYFYMCWKIEYIFLILISTVVDYFCAIFIENSKNLFRRKLLLTISIAVNLLILFLFKYFNFISESICIAFQRFNVAYYTPSLKLLLPIGISFYTFQTIGYTIDVFRGKKRAERHFGYLALYVAFFPQLVAGPIERSTHLLPQLRKKHFFDPKLFSSGLRLILFGFFKKLVIADRLAVYVNYVYSNPGSFSSTVLIFATIFFAFQIYCDFSGYTDIAIGSARLMGISLMQNFRAPYFSKSIPEFWHRWHISLSSWFRDYLYFSLGGNRVRLFCWIFNILLVFTLSGLWHGAGLTFIVWGFLHGLLYLLYKTYETKLSRLFLIVPINIRGLCAGVLNFVLVCFLWIFFRAENLTDALLIIRNILNFSFASSDFTLFGVPKFIQSLFFIGLLLLLDISAFRHLVMSSLTRKNIAFRWLFYYAVILLILFFGIFQQAPFIYFQF